MHFRACRHAPSAFGTWGRKSRAGSVNAAIDADAVTSALEHRDGVALDEGWIALCVDKCPDPHPNPSPKGRGAKADAPVYRLSTAR